MAFFVLSGLRWFLIVAEHCSCSERGLLWMFSIQSRSLESVTNLSAVSPRQFLVHKLALACISLLMHIVWLCLAARWSGVSLYDVPCVMHTVLASTSAPYLWENSKVKWVVENCFKSCSYFNDSNDLRIYRCNRVCFILVKKLLIMTLMKLLGGTPVQGVESPVTSLY